MRGNASPRPGFVESIYAELAERLIQEGREDLVEVEGGRSMGTMSDDVPVDVRRPGWLGVVAAAAAVLIAIGLPALLVRSTGPGAGEGIIQTTTTAPDDLMPGRPIGVGVPGVVDAYYVLYLPAGFDGSEPLPVVIALGTESGGNSGGLGFWGPENADSLGVAVVSVAPSGHAWAYPPSEDEAALIEDTWFGGPPPVGDADVLMVETVLNDIAERLPVEAVFVVGEYRGGLMAGRIACEIPDRIAAVAGYPNAAYVPAACDPASSPVSLMSIGPDDPDTEDPFTPASAAATLADRGERAKCRETSETSPQVGVTAIQYSDCAGGTQHRLVLFDVDALEDWEGPVPAIWEFFASIGSSP
jgi:hypothetical protein